MAGLNGASSDGHDEDDEDDYEENGGSRFLGFMFGNVDDSGDLDVDYLDEEAKEHIAALADKLGSSLKDIDLSIKSAAPTDASEQDYDEKALDAVDYEDIEEQYEGPEVEVPSEEDHLLSKKEYFSSEVSVAALDQKASIYDEEDYDEDEDAAKEPDSTNLSESKADDALAGGSFDSSAEKDWSEDMSKDQVIDNNMLKGKGLDDDLLSLGSVEEELVVDYDDVQEGNALLLDAHAERKETALPILCVENGMVILRFSEIFGVHQSLKRSVKGSNYHSSSFKERFRIVNLVTVAEEDEELFLKSSSQNFPASIRSNLTKEGELLTIDSDTEAERFGSSSSYVADYNKDSCLPAQPMKEMSDVDASVTWKSSLYSEYRPLDQEDWEHEIIWADSSPESFEVSANHSGLDSVDSEPHTNSQVGMVIRNQHLETMRQHDKIDNNKNGSSLDSPFSARLTGCEFSDFAGRNCHPQLLRLEAHLGLKNSVADHSNEKEAVGNDQCVGGVIKRLNKLSLRNKELLDGSWVDKIVWDSAELAPKPKLILDLQDERMLFEISDSHRDASHLCSHASAMIITRSSKLGCGDYFEALVQGGPPSGRFNISNDKYYSSNRKLSQLTKSNSKKRTAHGIKILHSVPALKLQTMKPKLSNKDIANFHRPKSIWYPHDNEVAAKKQGKLVAQGPMKIILKCMGGKGSKLHVAAEEILASVKVKASKKLDYKNTEKVKILCSGKELVDDQTLFMQNVRPNSVLHLVRSTIHLWPRAQKLPGENRPLRPPGAFKKKSELSVKAGHVFLMEYCEERPLLLGNVGMGARLCTYYQKIGSNDQTASLLKSENGLGNVVALDSADKSPFLGDIRPGSRQSSFETNMYRAPIYPQKTSSTDYLLVRSSKGKLSLRRVDKLYTVGQQEPHIEVMSPGSKNVQTYLGNRLLVYLFREFRAKEKLGSLPSVQVDELSAQFPNISEAILRKRVKHCADLQRGCGGQLLWVMRRNFRIPSEEELRRLITPENVCAYESMQAGLYRLKRLGITRLTHPAGLSFAMNQLPDEAIALAAASHIERELQITSWNLSSNFVACTNQDRENIERLEITGVGDPSGRGLGFSYVRVAPKAPVATPMMKKKTAAARGSSAVTGTDADLRRLSMDAAREVLIKFKVPEEQIDKMTRWHRIAMVRKLSSEQASSGVQVHSATLSKFARGQRMSFLQLQQQAREKCQEIWDRQAQSLSAVEGDENDSDSEANSDLDSFAGDLENLLDAEECEEGDSGNIQSKGGIIDGVRGLKMRRAPWQCQTEEEIEDEAAEAAELWRMLIDDDGMDKKNKNKARPVGEYQAMNTSKGEVAFPRKILGVSKLKNPKHEFLQSGLLKKKNKTHDDVFKLKEKKNPDRPIRENFVCGACGQQGHMRTNKNCPKYGEEIESILKAVEPEIPKPPPRHMSEVPASQQLESPSFKKLLKMTSAETPESSEQLGSKKVLPLKLKCSSEKSLDRYISDPETGVKPAVKINKIILSNKMKLEDGQLETPKNILYAKPPQDVSEADQPRKKLIIKQGKALNNVEEVRHSIGFGVDENFKKTKRMVELSGFDSYRKQDVRFYEEEIAAHSRVSGDRRFWEKEEKRRKDRLKEEKVKRMYEEERMEQQRHIEFLRYEEALMNGREWAKAKKKKKKRKDETDDYLEEMDVGDYDHRMEHRSRAVKKRPIADLGHYSAEAGPYTKRRKGGEVALSNILESIVDKMRDKREISYLFLKPVSKKDAPDYLDIIDTPMDLSTIRDKVRKMGYRSKREFRRDVWQIAVNAHRYNDLINPGIPPLADQLLRFCDHLLRENQELLNDAESGIEQWS